MAYSPMFFMQIIEAFLVRTEPDSSMVNPAHIHITNAPQTRNEKVLRMNCVSSSTPAAWATDGQTKNAATGTITAPSMAAAR